MPHAQPFDLAELSRRIDQEREKRGLTMTALAREVGVAASTIRRFRTADDAEADGVLALIGWLGDPPEHFIPDSWPMVCRAVGSLVDPEARVVLEIGSLLGGSARFWAD